MLTLDEHLRILRRVCQPFVRATHRDLEDLVQEAWIATRGLTNGLIPFKARQRMLDILRQTKRRLKNEEAYAQHKRLVSPCRDGEIRLEALDVGSLVDRAGLDDRDRDLLYRFIYEGQSARAIARSLNMHHSTIATRIKNIIHLIRAKSKFTK